MDTISINLKPIFWRLLIWRSVSGLLLSGIAVLLSVVTPTSSFIQTFSIRMIPVLLGIFAAQIIMSLIELFSKRLSIEIKEGEITGAKPGLFGGSQKIYLQDLERTNILEKNIFQKLFRIHKLCSTRGEIINFSPFVYEKSSVDEFYKVIQIVQDENLKSKRL